MTSTEIKEKADELRKEAKDLFNREILSMPDGYCNTAVDRVVDCIISCAMLEITALNAQLLESRHGS